MTSHSAPMCRERDRITAAITELHTSRAMLDTVPGDVATHARADRAAPRN
ncbi:hypothetical protein [Nocardia niwae]|nr:hypothetical protein [Nocardia niwae]